MRRRFLSRAFILIFTSRLQTGELLWLCQKSNQAKPRVAKGTNPTTRDRGEIAYGVAPMQNKAVVSGSQMVMMQNASGQHTRRAPKKDILR